MDLTKARDFLKAQLDQAESQQVSRSLCLSLYVSVSVCVCLCVCLSLL